MMPESQQVCEPQALHAAHSSATLTIAAQNQIKTGEVEEIRRGYVPTKPHPNAVRVTQLNCVRTG
jgi:hypothetical protein